VNGSILSTETHLHLYGCLSAIDLWDMFCQRRSKLQKRLEWFGKGYFAKFGKDPGLSDLSKIIDFADFKRIYEVTHQTDFAGFQAKFDLSIALAPPNPLDMSPLRIVLSRDALQGGTKEYRVFDPFYLDALDRESYLLNTLRIAREFTSQTFRPLIALTVQRDDSLLESQLRWLFDFLKNNPKETEILTGLDFCGEESKHSPIRKARAFKEIHEKTKLSILYHIGEMWHPEEVLLNLKWIHDSIGLGVKRLGHALILGCPIPSSGDLNLRMEIGEYYDFLTWLTSESLTICSDLNEHFSLQDLLESKAVVTGSQAFVTLDEELIYGVTQLQKWLRQKVKESHAVIEVCPTSNLRTTSLNDINLHPLHAFHLEKIPFTISTDDPGMFDITLKHEESLIKKSLLLSDTELELIESTAKNLLKQ
jgi:hypothetical protein